MATCGIILADGSCIEIFPLVWYNSVSKQEIAGGELQ